MTLAEAYKTLGLTPHVEYALAGERRDGQGLGATTWMLVEAALAMIEGQDVRIVGRTQEEARRMVLDLNVFANTLNVHNATLGEAEARSKQGKVIGRHPRYKVFDDLEYEERIADIKRGPYASIRALERQPDGSFKAFNSRGEFLLELTEEGGEQILEADLFRVTVR